MPSPQVGDIYRIEMVQHCAKRFSNFNRAASVTAMLNYLNWPTLEQRGNQSCACFIIIDHLISVHVVPHDHLMQSPKISHIHMQHESFQQIYHQTVEPLPEQNVFSPDFDYFTVRYLSVLLV